MRFVLATLIIFTLANALVEYLRRHTDNWLTEPLSDYLTGPYGLIQSSAYILFAAGLLRLGMLWGEPILYLSAFAVALVVMTKLDYARHPEEHWLIHLHVISAGVAYASATAALIHHAGGWMPWLGPIAFCAVTLPWKSVSALIQRMSGVEPSQSAIGEKAYTAGLLASFFLLVR